MVAFSSKPIGSINPRTPVANAPSIAVCTCWRRTAKRWLAWWSMISWTINWWILALVCKPSPAVSAWTGSRIPIGILPVLLVSLDVIDVRLALWMRGYFCFCNLLVESHLWHRTLKRRGGPWEVSNRRRMCILVSGTVGAVSSKEGCDARRRCFRLAVVGTKAVFWRVDRRGENVFDMIIFWCTTVKFTLGKNTRSS